MVVVAAAVALAVGCCPPPPIHSRASCAHTLALSRGAVVPLLCPVWVTSGRLDDFALASLLVNRTLAFQVVQMGARNKHLPVVEGRCSCLDMALGVQVEVQGWVGVLQVEVQVAGPAASAPRGWMRHPQM